MTAVVQSERGVALIMVLWIFMVLTVLVGDFSRAMRDDATASQNLAEEVQARGVATAAMNQAIYRTLRARERGSEPTAQAKEPELLGEQFEEWPADGTWHEGTYWAGSYSVRLIDEGGKISLNRADEALLKRVFENLGFDDDAQQELTDAIIDWRDSDDLHRLHGAESEYYLKLPEPYQAKNGRFDSVDELLLVRGITQDLFYGTTRGGFGDERPTVPLRDVFSAFSQSATINVRTAPDAVLRILLGGEGDEESVEEVIEARAEDPASALTLIRAKVGADPVLARRFVDRSPSTIAIEARAVMQNGRVQARVGAVVKVTEDADGFAVERWFDRLPAR